MEGEASPVRLRLRQARRQITLLQQDDAGAPGLWLGGFKYGFTDNPAWIMLCILTHKRAGLGRVLDPALIDVGAFYQVAQYCDELVPDGRGGS